METWRICGVSYLRMVMGPCPVTSRVWLAAGVQPVCSLLTRGVYTLVRVPQVSEPAGRCQSCQESQPNPETQDEPDVWLILGLWVGLALLVALAASRWLRYLRDPDQGVYSSREERTDGLDTSRQPDATCNGTRTHDHP